MSSTGCSTLPNCASVARNRRSCGSPRCSRSGDTAVTDPVETPAKAVPPKADPETLVLRAAPGRVARFRRGAIIAIRSEEHTSELQSLMRISYAVLCLTKKNKKIKKDTCQLIPHWIIQSENT